MLLKLEGFQYVTSLDLDIRYYHIQLNKNASNVCTIITLWGKYRYKCLAMKVAKPPDIFQQKTNYLFHIFEFIRAYIYDLSILPKGDWKYHMQNMEIILNKLKEKGLKYNIEN